MNVLRRPRFNRHGPTFYLFSILSPTSRFQNIFFILLELSTMTFSTQPTKKKNKKKRIEKRKKEREAHSSENSNAHLLLGDNNLLFVVRPLAIHIEWL